MVATRYRRRSATVAVIAVTALVPGVLALAPARSVPVASGGAGQVNVLALTSTHITGFPGRPVTVIKGKVWTAAATVSGPIGRSVSLQRLVGKKWTTAASAKTAKKGLVRIAVTPSSSGNYRLSVPAFGHFAGASSAAEQVTVKPAPALQTWPTTISGTFSGYARDPYNPVDGAHWSWEGNVATGEGSVALGAAPGAPAFPEPPDESALAPTATAAVPAAAMPVHLRNDRRVPTTRRLVGGVALLPAGSSICSFNSAQPPLRRSGEGENPLQRQPTDR